MLKSFQSNIQKNQLFDNRHRLLLAFSGGVDSVVLAELLHRAGYRFDLAHCNFQLRGAEADSDEAFCLDQAARLHVKLHQRRFDTAAYATQTGRSIQMAARDLRYQWFQQLCQEYDYDFLITAHHLNDQIETFFVNLTRGTGISGLKGIPIRQGNIVRPLLFATKEEILQYATEQRISLS